MSVNMQFWSSNLIKNDPRIFCRALIRYVYILKPEWTGRVSLLLDFSAVLNHIFPTAAALIRFHITQPLILISFSPAPEPRLPAHPHPQQRPGAPGEGRPGRPRPPPHVRVVHHRQGHQVPLLLARLDGEHSPYLHEF